MTPRIRQFLSDDDPASPCLVIDLDAVARSYRRLCAALPEAEVFYAVKANPGAPLLSRLAGLGSSFDCASPPEIAAALAAGASPDRLSYGNTIKKERDIAAAYAAGVRLFATDSADDLARVARAAPGASVFCRILTLGHGADWPLSRKFGCEPEMAADLLIAAPRMGLSPRGVSFHVGSQQRDITQWGRALATAAEVFRIAGQAGIDLDLLNMGGGFPAHYLADVPELEEYTEAVRGYLHDHFGSALPRLIVEPGRSLVGDAGALRAEVVMVSKKGNDDDTRWVFLDVGKFGGLAETMDEAIKYRIETDRDGGAVGPVVLAGPTCDSADILYEHYHYRLPLNLASGDRVLLSGAGAYTTTYASVGFNGFAPLAAHYI